MSGVKFRSGDIPKEQKRWRMSIEDRALLVLQRILRDKTIDPVDKARLALPIYLKTQTDKQAITQLTATMQLNEEQVHELIEIAKANALVYKGLGNVT